jgi:hypothetical protein
MTATYPLESQGQVLSAGLKGSDAQLTVWRGVVIKLQMQKGTVTHSLKRQGQMLLAPSELK